MGACCGIAECPNKRTPKVGGAGHLGGPGQKDVSQAVVREKEADPMDNLSHELPAHRPYWAVVTFKGHSLL